MTVEVVTTSAERTVIADVTRIEPPTDTSAVFVIESTTDGIWYVPAQTCRFVRVVPEPE